MRIRVMIGETAVYDSTVEQRAGTTDILVGALAALWAELDDDTQALFFEKAARSMAGWPLGGAAGRQGYYIGKHMSSCECVTHEGRELIRSIAQGMGE